MSVRWRSFGARWAVMRAPERANPAIVPHARAPKNAPAAGRGRSIEASSAYIGQDTARQVSASLGASLTPLAQTRRSSLA